MTYDALLEWYKKPFCAQPVSTGGLCDERVGHHGLHTCTPGFLTGPLPWSYYQKLWFGVET